MWQVSNKKKEKIVQIHEIVFLSNQKHNETVPLFKA